MKRSSRASPPPKEPMTDHDLILSAQTLGTLLLRQGHLLATAESCTGGWVAQTVTEIAGSSAWFDRGFVAYSNEAKQAMLGVPGETLQRWGAVSEATVLAMAEGAIRHSGAHCALAVSGIAGPGGGTAEKPVGLVWIAWQKRGEQGIARCFHFSGDRHEVRRQAVLAALQGLVERYGG